MQAMLTISSAVAECWLRRPVGWGTSSQEVGFATLRRFQKEGSRAGVPIGCKTSAPSRGSKEMRNCQWRVSATFLPTFFPNGDDDDDDDIFKCLCTFDIYTSSPRETTHLIKQGCSRLEGGTLA